VRYTGRIVSVNFMAKAIKKAKRGNTKSSGNADHKSFTKSASKTVRVGNSYAVLVIVLLLVAFLVFGYWLNTGSNGHAQVGMGKGYDDLRELNGEDGRPAAEGSCNFNGICDPGENTLSCTNDCRYSYDPARDTGQGSYGRSGSSREQCAPGTTKCVEGVVEYCVVATDGFNSWWVSEEKCQQGRSDSGGSPSSGRSPGEMPEYYP
jgi:hypothetical protein